MPILECFGMPIIKRTYLQAIGVVLLQLVLQPVLAGGGEEVDECTTGSTAAPFRHLSKLSIAAPTDASDVWGTFSVRIEFSHRLSLTVDPPEALPSAFDVMLDGEHALQVTLKNSTRSFYLIHIPPLEVGWHVVQVALRYAGDEDMHSPAWVPLEQDRARYQSRGPQRPAAQAEAPLTSNGLFGVTVRHMHFDRVQEEAQRWRPDQTAILVVDMWAFHGCRPAMVRARELVGPINSVISAARKRGTFIIHVPSRCVGPLSYMCIAMM